MTKTVKRTYTKKDGTKVTKVYVYQNYKPSKTRRSKSLVTKSGKVNKDALGSFKDAIINSSDLSEATKQDYLKRIDVAVKSAHDNKYKLTVSGLKGRLMEVGSISDIKEREEAKIRMMFVNAGYSLEEAAEELGVDELDLLNEANWNNGQLTLGDKTYEIKFTYTGSMFHEL